MSYDVTTRVYPIRETTSQLCPGDILTRVNRIVVVVGEVGTTESKRYRNGSSNRIVEWTWTWYLKWARTGGLRDGWERCVEWDLDVDY